ncbi:hypothetical protein POM88_045367 [Heracleum sosnowskyi]|uniref:TF-B3 domain-containing protein n=1 Tax=Heracleum sosnowskyi TaxID=360622 RepID=A0AAD8H6B6_9APIA|nr:hypothetical protein POM88_045367 [Heracleum sosnowskyi]
MCKEDQFLVKYLSLEYQNCLAHLTFNGILLYPNYVRIDTISMDVDPRNKMLTIPSFINPANRQWMGGERILLRMEDEAWSVGLAVSNGRARFSARWNKFARENKLKRRQILVFNMDEVEAGVVFEVTKAAH